MRRAVAAMCLAAACGPAAGTGDGGVPAPVPPPAPLACGLTERFEHRSFDGPVTVRAGDGALLFAAPMHVNTDGAPTSYHPDDPFGTEGLAINTICNGASAKLASGETLGPRECRRLVEAFRQARAANWQGFPRMEFYAVATRGGRPCTTATGHFVSTTSLAADPSRGVCDPARYLDALTVPFVIYPGHRNFIDRGVGTGDLAVTLEPDSGRSEFAVVGDRGPARGLSEGSVFLARTLRGVTETPTTYRESVRLVVPKAWTLVFPDASLAPPVTTERIREAARAAFEAWGGQARLAACIAEGG